MSRNGTAPRIPGGPVPLAGQPPPALTATPQAQAVRALTQMQQQLTGAVTAMLRAYEPPRTRCWPCFARRCDWEGAHGAEWEQAQQDARAKAGGQQVPSGAAIAELAEELRPGGTDGMPGLYAATMTIDGTGYCDSCAQERAGTERQLRESAAGLDEVIRAPGLERIRSAIAAAGPESVAVPAASSAGAATSAG